MRSFFIRAIGWAIFAGAAGAVIFKWLVEPRLLRWNTTDSELASALPGDELVLQATRVRMQAITVRAPREQVWPWLLQLGQQKAGFYSFEWIENRLLGCDIHNSDRIVPEWQQTGVGDPVHMVAPGRPNPPPYVVAAIAPPAALILGHQNADGQTWHDTWQFVLQPIDAQTTRLLLRARSLSMGIFDLVEPGYVLMECGMLHGIKARAEKGDSRL